MSTFNDKTIKNVADAVSEIMEVELSEGMVHPADAHRILNQTGGIKTLHHSLSDDQVSQRVKLAKEHGYVAKGDSPTGRSRAYRTTMHLQKQAAKHNPAFDVNEAAELSPKQKAIAKLAEPKHKIDAEDLAKLRAGHKPVKEESEQMNELSKATLGRYINQAAYSGSMASFKQGKAVGDAGAYSKRPDKATAKQQADIALKREKGIGLAVKKLTKEEIQSKTKKTFSEMVELYNQKGLKSLQEMFINEEPTEEQFVKELERQKRKAAGTAPESEKAKVAAAATKGVKNMPEETEIDERTLTEPEMEKREEVVKSMKKKMPEFKERYGKRAKEVLYATATKVAKGD